MSAAELPIPPAATARNLPAGNAFIAVERWRGRSVATSVHASSPLRVLTPKNHGPFAWLYLSTLGGGLVQGDRVSLELDLASDAQALISSQGWTRVYAGEGSELSLDAAVAADATLVWLPDPTTCFANARLTQRSALRLERGASLLYLDTLCSGRSGCGERWAFSRVRTELELTLSNRPLVHEAWELDPRHGELSRRMGRFDALATLILSGPAFSQARAKLEPEINAPFAATGLSSPDALATASSLGEETLLVRFADVSLERLQRRLRAALEFLPALLGDDPFARRF